MKIHKNLDCSDAFKQAYVNHIKAGNDADHFISVCEQFSGQELTPAQMTNIMASVQKENPRMKINKHGQFFGIRKIKEDCGQ